jgi:predicted DNA binding CopG/RHH family protein
MKNKKNKPIYAEEPADEGWKFAEGPALDPDQQKALGIPEPAAAAKMKVARKPARPARINIRTTHETIAGLRARAEEAGLPYQTLAASVLHMVAKGELKLSLSRVG